MKLLCLLASLLLVQAQTQAGCEVQLLMDVYGSTRTDTHPNGIAVSGPDECCDICNADAQCVLAVLQEPTRDYCWTIKAFAGLQEHNQRTVIRKKSTLNVSDFRPACKTNADCQSGACNTLGQKANGDSKYYYCAPPASCDASAPRSINGICNNLNDGRRLQGSTGHLQLRFIQGSPSARVNTTVSPRTISDRLGATGGVTPNPFGGNSLLVYFGQFVDHDVTIVHPNAQDTTIIQGSGDVPDIKFENSEKIGAPGNLPGLTNDLTAYLDLSQVYGSDIATANALRSGTGGLLASQFINGKEYLPTVAELQNQVEMAMGFLPGSFAAGDIRANEHMTLAALHTLFLREHNRLARRFTQENPSLSDEALYQRARKWNIAQYQNIVLTEFFRGWYGEFLPTYTGYNDQETPDIDVLFSTATFRFGHSCIRDVVRRTGRNGADFSVNLGEVFFRPNLVTQNGGIDSILKGQVRQCHEKWDTRIVDGLRNMLFENIPGTNGSVAMDLMALNVQRCRDHACPKYTDARAHFGLSVPRTFNEVTGGRDNGVITGILESLYGKDNVAACDPFICGLAEPPTRGQQGELFFWQNRDQFRRLRDADRFYFENRNANGPGFTANQISRIKNTSMHDILRRNTFLNGNAGDNQNYVNNAFVSNEC